MAVDDTDGRRRAKRKEEYSSQGVENERTDAERDVQTCLARPNSQARTGQGK